MRSRTRVIAVVVTVVVVAAVTVIAVALTGGSAPPSRRVSPPGAPVSRGPAAVARPAGANQAADPEAVPVATVAPAADPPPPAPDPCRLVSRQEAQAIIGLAVAAPVEAPLGPTCIYGVAGGLAKVTVSISPVAYRTLAATFPAATAATVSGRGALCTTTGHPLLLTPLGQGRTLEVGADCATAARFAAAALSHLGGR